MSRDDYYASPFGVVYSTYIGRPWLGRPIARLVWGGDARRYYESMDAVGELPAGSTVVDCPVGAGPALRALPADGRIHYIGADLSPAMLRRARKRATSRGLTHVELVEADAIALPLDDASADLFLSFWGLHCFEEPAAALAEAARVLRPGGRLLGSCFVRGTDTLRQRLLVRPHFGDFGPIGAHEEVESWLAAAGLRRRRPGAFRPDALLRGPCGLSTGAMLGRHHDQGAEMQCPVDGTELKMGDRQGVEIDYCPDCRGVWLDRGELDKIVERLSSAPWSQEEPEFKRETRDVSAKEYRKKKRKNFMEEMFDFG